MWTEEILLDDLVRTTDPDFALQNILMIGFVGILLLIIMIAVYKYIRKD